MDICETVVSIIHVGFDQFFFSKTPTTRLGCSRGGWDDVLGGTSSSSPVLLGSARDGGCCWVDRLKESPNLGIYPTENPPPTSTN